MEKVTIENVAKKLCEDWEERARLEQIDSDTVYIYLKENGVLYSVELEQLMEDFMGVFVLGVEGETVIGIY